MDLDIPHTVGRPAKVVTGVVTRHLEAKDMQATLMPVGSTAKPIARLRDSHHELAKCLASGMKPADASIATGYSLSRISILQADSTFKELLEHYRGQVSQVFIDRVQRLAMVGDTALQILHERMEENPDEMADATLIKVAEFSMDRIGHGPQSKSTNVNVNVDLSSRLDAARKRAGLSPAPAALPAPSSVTHPPVIDVTAEDIGLDLPDE